MTASPFFSAAGRPMDVVGEGVQRLVLSHLDDLMLVRVEFAEGAVGPAHAHPHRQITYVESGRFEVTIGDAVAVLEAGDSFAAPGGVVHGVRCLAAGTLLDAFTPSRTDFLPPER